MNDENKDENKNKNKKTEKEGESSRSESQVDPTMDEVFKRRESLQRTPPSVQRATNYGRLSLTETSPRTRSNSFPGENANRALFNESDNTQGNKLEVPPRVSTYSLFDDALIKAEKKSAKRLRDEEDGDLTQEFGKQFDKLMNTVNELVKITDASTKTKLEIRDCVKKLQRYANDTSKVWKTLEKDDRCFKRKEEAKEMRSASVQASPEDIKKETEEKRRLLVDRIRTIMETKDKYDRLTEILDEKWPQEIYKVTITGNTNQMAMTERGDDYAILMDPKKAEYNKLEENLMLRYPGLAEMVKNSDGEPDFLVQTSNTRTKTGASDGECSAVHLLPMEIDTAGVNDMATVYDRIAKLKKNISVHPTEHMNLVISDGLKFSYVRKICEYVFANETMTIKLFAQRQRSDPQKPKLKRKEESTVTIKTQGKSFVDVVKKLKAEVNIEQLGVRVKRLQKTEKGDIRLTIEGGQDMATSLQDEVKNKVENVQVDIRRAKTTIVFVLGIDPTITEAEIRQALAREMKVQESEIIMKATRAAKNEEQTMIVEVPSAQAAPLIKGGKLRMAWTVCGIRERVDIMRCFRCLEYGHKTRECNSQVDRSKDCFKCGETGHKGKDCHNSDKCIRCGTEGHRADQIKCPHFKRLVEETRKRKTQSGRTTTNRI